jgi:hypothetical protein
MQEREERLKTINWYFFVPGSMHHQGGLESGMLVNFFEIIRFFSFANFQFRGCNDDVNESGFE